MYQSPRGTTDILPDEQAYWRFIEQKAAAISQLYGYRRIDTPLFEDTGLFVRGVGEETDIVQKEMYTFEDRGGNKLTLRPEGTASICRAYLEHGMQNLIEGFNALWQAKVWQRYRVGSAAELQQRSQAYIAAHRARTADAPAAPRRPMPKHFALDLHAPPRGQMIFIRRTDETGHAHLLGRRFAISPDWPHRLVRCEVDFDHHCIRCFALRRHAPAEQPLLATIHYERTNKPFQGEP